MKRLLGHPRVHSAIVCALFAAAVGHQLWHGADTTPRPLRELLLWLWGLDDAVAARLIVAVEFGLGAAVLIVGNRMLAMVAAIAFGFVSLSCASAAMRGGGLVLPLLGVLGSAGAVLLMANTRRSVRTGTSHALRRGLSPAWSAIASLAVATAGASLTSDVDFRAQPMSDAEAKARARSINLDLKPFIGRPVEETPIAMYLPALASSLTAGRGSQTTFVVFYNPHCDACHTLFDANFGAPRPERVVAVEIPPPDDAVIAAHEELGPINCPQCEFESLAPGPLWLVAPPMTVKIEDGVITCVADRFGGDCINPQ